MKEKDGEREKERDRERGGGREEVGEKREGREGSWRGKKRENVWVRKLASGSG